MGNAAESQVDKPRRLRETGPSANRFTHARTAKQSAPLKLRGCTNNLISQTRTFLFKLGGLSVNASAIEMLCEKISRKRHCCASFCGLTMIPTWLAVHLLCHCYPSQPLVVERVCIWATACRRFHINEIYILSFYPYVSLAKPPVVLRRSLCVCSQF